MDSGLIYDNHDRQRLLEGPKDDPPPVGHGLCSAALKRLAQQQQQ